MTFWALQTKYIQKKYVYFNYINFYIYILIYHLYVRKKIYKSKTNLT